jgi:hypothetical protein
MNINPATVDALSAAEGIAATIAADAVAAPQANPVAALQANPVATPPVNTAAAAAGVTPAIVATQAVNPAGAGASFAPQANAPALPSFNDAAIMLHKGTLLCLMMALPPPPPPLPRQHRGTLLAYYPMKLKEYATSSHTSNGMRQLSTTSLSLYLKLLVILTRLWIE